MTNARLHLLTAVWYLVMLSKNCLQVKCLGIKKASLLLLKSTKNSGRKYFEVSAIVSLGNFCGDPLPSPAF